MRRSQASVAILVLRGCRKRPLAPPPPTVRRGPSRAPGTMPPTTPITKKRKVRASAVQAGVDNLLVNSCQADKAYINRMLDENEAIVPVLASMIRDGEIDRALKRKETAALTQALGLKLNARCRKFRNFTPRLWKLLLQNILGAKSLSDFAGDKDGFDDREVQHLCKFALGIVDDTPLPQVYDKAGYEGPLMSVLLARYKSQGQLLKNLSYDQLKAGVGYYMVDPADPTTMHVRGKPNLSFNLGYRREFFENMTLYVKDNHDLQKATLVDDDSGFAQNLFKRLEKEKPHHGMVQNGDGFEFPDAARAYRDFDPSQAADSAASSNAGHSSPGAASTMSLPPSPVGARVEPGAAVPPALPAGVPPETTTS